MKIRKTTRNMFERRGINIVDELYTACQLRQVGLRVRDDDRTARVVEFCDQSSDAAAWYIVDGSGELRFVSATIGDEWPLTISDEQQMRVLLPAIAQALTA